jgi:hypothetical protein
MIDFMRLQPNGLARALVGKKKKRDFASLFATDFLSRDAA